MCCCVHARDTQYNIRDDLNTAWRWRIISTAVIQNQNPSSTRIIDLTSRIDHGTGLGNVSIEKFPVQIPDTGLTVGCSDPSSCNVNAIPAHGDDEDCEWAGCENRWSEQLMRSHVHSCHVCARTFVGYRCTKSVETLSWKGGKVLFGKTPSRPCARNRSGFALKSDG